MGSYACGESIPTCGSMWKKCGHTCTMTIGPPFSYSIGTTWFSSFVHQRSTYLMYVGLYVRMTMSLHTKYHHHQSVTNASVCVCIQPCGKPKRTRCNGGVEQPRRQAAKLPLATHVRSCHKRIISHSDNSQRAQHRTARAVATAASKGTAITACHHRETNRHTRIPARSRTTNPAF